MVEAEGPCFVEFLPSYPTATNFSDTDSVCTAATYVVAADLGSTKNGLAWCFVLYKPILASPYHYSVRKLETCLACALVLLRAVPKSFAWNPFSYVTFGPQEIDARASLQRLWGSLEILGSFQLRNDPMWVLHAYHLCRVCTTASMTWKAKRETLQTKIKL